jgi:hypothetical protein
MSSFTINKNASTLMFSTEHDSPRFRENNLGQKLTQCQCSATSKIKQAIPCLRIQAGFTTSREFRINLVRKDPSCSNLYK